MYEGQAGRGERVESSSIRGLLRTGFYCWTKERRCS
jgi:hypothetical protein